MPVDPAFGLRSLGNMARTLSISAPLHPLLETAAEEALGALRAASVSIAQLDEDGRLVRVLINVGDLSADEVRWPVDETYALAEWDRLSAVLTDKITRTDHLGADDCDPMEAELLQSVGKGSSVTAAILVDGRVWGEFYATRHLGEEPFVENSVDYVDALMAILGAGISRSLREATLERLAFHDALTGALNRRGFEQAAAHVHELPDEAVRALTLVALDINGLKDVNDSQGHPRGDELIRTVARALHEAFAPYPGSLVARMGGDEFTALVPHHDPTSVARTVEALCDEVGQDRSFGPSAGLSAGVAHTLLTGRDDVTHNELMEAADRALYQAKALHRSAAVLTDEHGPTRRGGRRAGDGRRAASDAGRSGADGEV